MCEDGDAKLKRQENKGRLPVGVKKNENQHEQHCASILEAVERMGI
jgi:hypothetical protein